MFVTDPEWVPFQMTMTTIIKIFFLPVDYNNAIPVAKACKNESNMTRNFCYYNQKGAQIYRINYTRSGII